MRYRIYKDFKAVATLLEQSATVLSSISETCRDLDAKDQSFRN